jgi:acetyl esterase/lipase
VRSRASTFGIDPARVVLLGASAGGNLAALAGTDPRAIRIAGGKPSAVISLSGPMDLPLMARHAAALDGCAIGPRRPLGCSVSESILARLPVLLGCPIDGRTPWIARTRRPAPCPGLYRRGSPVVQAGPGDASMLLVHGAEDPLVPAAHARRMGAALRAGGVEHRVVILPGSVHGTRLLAPALPQIRAFIDRR